jgi:hypothetical protein
VDWIAGVGRLDGACGDGGFHDARLLVSTHGLSRRHDKCFNRSLVDSFSQVLSAGTRIEKFVIERVLGAGGFAK